MKKKTDSKEREFNENVKELVMARIAAQMPSNLRLCIGQGEGSLSGAQMIEHIKEDDEIGNQIIKSHLNFIRAQSNGQLLSALNSVS